MKWWREIMPEKTCEICSRKISLKEHPSGLVFRDEIFVCEDCADKHSHEEIKRFTKTTMQNPENGMPIGLWLIHEQNKNKTMMTVKK
jgi:ribosome-binding protein aMBF1 (putative translation factor)